MVCKNCGTEIVKGGKFCPKCGTQIAVKKNFAWVWAVAGVSVAAVATGIVLFNINNKPESIQEETEVVESVGNEMAQPVDYTNYIINNLVPQYGKIAPGDYNLYAERDWDSYETLYAFPQKMEGILNTWEFDVNQDGEDELLVLRLVETKNNNDAILDIYARKNNQIEQISTHRFEEILMGEKEMNASFSLFQNENECYFIYENEWMASSLGCDGGDDGIEIYKISDSGINFLFDGSIGGFYSGLGNDEMIFSNNLNKIGMTYSAECCDIVAEDGVIGLYELAGECVDTNWEKCMVLYSFNDQPTVKSKSEKYRDDINIKIISYDLLAKWSEEYPDLLYDNILYTISYNRNCLEQWGPGEYHVVLDEESFRSSDEGILFSGTVVENGLPFEVMLVSGEYSYDADVIINGVPD